MCVCSYNTYIYTHTLILLDIGSASHLFSQRQFEIYMALLSACLLTGVIRDGSKAFGAFKSTFRAKRLYGLVYGFLKWVVLKVGCMALSSFFTEAFTGQFYIAIHGVYCIGSSEIEFYAQFCH